MSKAIDNLQAAQKQAMAIRPKVGGFPYLAETLRRAGVTTNIWSLPACQSIFLTNDGAVVMQGTPLVTGAAESEPPMPKSLSREVTSTALERAQTSRRQRALRQKNISGRFVPA